MSQEEIARKLTPSKNGFRVDDEKIKQFLNKNNFEYEFYWWDKTPFNEPYAVLNEINNNEGFIGMKDHAYRVLKFIDPLIIIVNPENGLLGDFEYTSLMNKLRELDGGFGLIKKLK